MRHKFLANILHALVYIPFLLLLFIATITSGSDFDEFEEIFLLTSMMVSIIATVYIATALSLRMPYGMIPVAAVICVLGNMLLIFMAQNADDEMIALLLYLVWGSVIITLHSWIGAEVRRRAGRTTHRIHSD